jgi:hypothetical protein
MPPRNRTGTRKVTVKERDPVAERMTALDALNASYAQSADDAWKVYEAEAKAAWDRWQAKLAAASTAYWKEVERIRGIE